MGQKPIGPAQGFALMVIKVIDEARREQGLTKKQLFEAADIPANTFHTKMRGERPFDMNDIDRLARALDRDPLLILQEAGAGFGDNRPTVIPFPPRNVRGPGEDDLHAVARPADLEPTDEQ